MTATREMGPDLADALRTLLLDLEASSDSEDQVLSQLLREGLDEPLDADEAVELLDRVLDRIAEHGRVDGDARLTARILAARAGLRQRVAEGATGLVIGPDDDGDGDARLVELGSHEGIDPRPVHPRPTFYGREIPLMAGFVSIDELVLWVENERLEVHVEQFERKWSRRPDPRELLDIMCSDSQLEGLEGEDDQFKILALARSIAANGVRRPPVIDRDGTLLDGNRRVAACLLVRNSEEFGPAEKRRAETLFVWQLTEHALAEDRERVVVALNFEPDLKEEWPEYIKARKVADRWRDILELEQDTPTIRRAATLKRELSQEFALGPETSVVNRYIKMVDLADEFEEHQAVSRGHDASAVKHAASRYFQYFDELGKGARPGGVAHTLGQDDVLRHLVFDLLYEGKISNWRQVRKLKYAAENQDVVDQLKLARDIRDDLDEAQEKVEFALSLGETASKQSRELGANTRVKAFTEWLNGLPMDAFSTGVVSSANIEELVKSLSLARQQAIPVLGQDRVRELLAA